MLYFYGSKQNIYQTRSIKNSFIFVITGFILFRKNINVNNNNFIPDKVSRKFIGKITNNYVSKLYSSSYTSMDDWTFRC